MRNGGFLIESHTVLTCVFQFLLGSFPGSMSQYYIPVCVFPVLEQSNQTVPSVSGDMFLTWQASKMMLGKFTSFAHKTRDIKPLRKQIWDKIADFFSLFYLVWIFCHSTNKPPKKKKQVEKWNHLDLYEVNLNSTCFFQSRHGITQPTNPSLGLHTA